MDEGDRHHSRNRRAIVRGDKPQGAGSPGVGKKVVRFRFPGGPGGIGHPRGLPKPLARETGVEIPEGPEGPHVVGLQGSP